MRPFHFWLLIVTGLCFVASKENWARPGCHKVGNTRKISIPECVEFHITTNACRGFCESYAVPSMIWGNGGYSLGAILKPTKPVVSVGQCCSMMSSEEVTIITLICSKFHIDYLLLDTKKGSLHRWCAQLYI